MKNDTNFDPLHCRFERNIYNSAKGKIRLAVIERDIQEQLTKEIAFPSSRVLDAGCGPGHVALSLARKGACLCLCDISTEMLAASQKRFSTAKIPANQYALVNCALQDIGRFQAGPYDLILCHAVAEWLARPEDVFDALLPLLKQDGWLSLVFYNFYGLEFKNLLRTNFKHFHPQDFQSHRGSLTPTRPLKPEEVMAWAAHHHLDLQVKSGIRVFHDYIFNKQDREREPEVLLQKELEYSRLDPYWKLGRYIHFLYKKTGHF